ncbi:hypothetical protein ACFO6V_28005 [Promicromonospora alba]|uniref:HK97 family phage major capsid protein n=1 Tax=Promicromonospora alba TaxID=1616110 RepID=A0ABV9HRH3_9MICO
MQLFGTLLAADTDSRTLKYLLLPYGKAGSTSAGLVQASEGAVTVPQIADLEPLNMEHDHTRPVGRFSSVTETPEGLVAEVTLSTTTAANDALLEAREGLRRGISVELRDVVIRAGRLVSAVLSGAGLVARPAFSDALLIASDQGVERVAVDTEDLPEISEASSVADEEEAEAETSNEETEIETTMENEITPEAEETYLAASAPVGLPFNKGNHNKPNLTANDVFKAVQDGNAKELTAALAQTNSADLTAPVGADTWLGEIWNKVERKDIVADLVTVKPLNSRKVKGYHITNVDEFIATDWAMDGSEIASVEAEVDDDEATATRYGLALSVDRSFQDLGEEEFVESYSRKVANAVSKRRDAKVLNALTNLSASVTANPGAVPAGVDPTLVRIVDGILYLQDRDLAPAYVLLGATAFRNYSLISVDDRRAFLTESLGLDGGALDGVKIRRVPANHPTFGAETVIVATKTAVTLHEPAGTPLRVDATALSIGQLERAFFGYAAILVNEGEAVQINATA